MKPIPNDILIEALTGKNAPRWYGDGEPTWTVGNDDKSPKTAREAKQERLRLIKVLKRNSQDYPGAKAVMDVLETCAPQARCLSGACPECMRAFQRWFVTTAAGFLRPRRRSTKVASLIDTTCETPEDNLQAGFRYATYRKRLTSIFSDATIRHAIVGIDISMNEHQLHEFHPHWQPHLWVISSKIGIERSEGMLRYYFGSSSAVLRPVMIKGFNCNNSGIAYTVKTDFQRRISLPKQNSSSNTEKRRRNTRDKDLKSSQKTELSIFLHGLGLRKRILLVGLEIVTTDSSFKLRFIRTSSSH